MTECILAWVCLCTAAWTQDPLWAIASAAFAIATHLSFRR